MTLPPTNRRRERDGDSHPAPPLNIRPNKHLSPRGAAPTDNEKDMKRLLLKGNYKDYP